MLQVLKVWLLSGRRVYSLLKLLSSIVYSCVIAWIQPMAKLGPKATAYVFSFWTNPSGSTLLLYLYFLFHFSTDITPILSFLCRRATWFLLSSVALSTLLRQRNSPSVVLLRFCNDVEGFHETSRSVCQPCAWIKREVDDVVWICVRYIFLLTAGKG